MNRIPTVAHFRGDFGRISQTFIYDLVVGIPGQRAVLVYGEHVDPDGEFPLPPYSIHTTINFKEPDTSVEPLADQLRERGVSLVHAHFGYDLPLAALVADQLGVPLVATFHGADASSFANRYKWQAIYRTLLPRVDALVIIDPGKTDRLVEFGARPERIHHIPLGIDLDFWEPAKRSPSTTAVRILSVGRLVEKKGHDLLIHAVGRAVRDGFDLRLVIAGDGDEERLLQELIRAYDLEDRVTLAGNVDRVQVRKLMTDTDIFALASHTTESGDEEGSPVVLTEAMAMGLPVLSTLHADIPSVVNHGVTGILVPEGSIDDLSRGLRQLAAMPGRWKEMGRAGRRWVRQHRNRETVLERWRALYDHVLSARMVAF